MTVAGTNLENAEEVNFGATAISCPSAACLSDTATAIEIEAPAGTGTVTSGRHPGRHLGANHPNDEYTYNPPVVMHALPSTSAAPAPARSSATAAQALKPAPPNTPKAPPSP